jgi:glycosyltransferase involved in cell wall biosynthesis
VADIGVVVTAFDQGELVVEAVESVERQSVRVADVIVVDDGSTDVGSLRALARLDRRGQARVVHRSNGGVSAARNTGLAALRTELAVVLDGDDRLAPTFVEETAAVLETNSDVVAASSWLQMHGIAQAIARPTGGRALDFLHRNACPSAVLLRRDHWQRSGGYDEQMRGGFEDWDFFLSLLAPGGRIDIVPAPLVEYRTAPASLNMRSMNQRLDLYGRIIDKHRPLFDRHLREVLLAQEAASMRRLHDWEQLMISKSDVPLEECTYGDGGMAAAVRIATQRASAGTASDPGGLHGDLERRLHPEGSSS